MKTNSSTDCSLEENVFEEIEISPREYNEILDFQQYILNKIASHDDYLDILDSLCKLAEQLLPNSVASIMMLSKHTGLMSVLSAPSVPQVGHEALENLKPGIHGGSCGNAVFHNEAQFVSNTFDDSRWENIRKIAIDFNLCSCWSMPIRDDQNRAIGSFALSSFEHRSPSLFHKKLLEVGASIVNIVLKNQDREQKLMLFSNAMQNASDGMIITNKENQIIEVNGAFLDTYGYKEESVLGMNPKIFSSNVNNQKIYTEMWKSIKETSKWSGEIINKDFDGNEIIQWVSISSLEDQHNYLAIYTDLTEIRAVQSELAKEKTFLKTLIQALPDLIWLKDINGNYLSCNSRIEECFGAKEEEIIGKTDYDFVNNDLANTFSYQDQQVIKSEEPLMSEDIVTFASDGHTEIVETRKVPMLDEMGKILGVLGVARDITVRKDAEKELVKLSLAVEQSLSLIIISDIHGQIEYANKSFFTFFDEYNSLEDLKKEHINICHKFEEYGESSYITEKEIDGLSWIDYVKKHPNETLFVAIRKGDLLSHFIIKVAQTSSKDDSFLVIELSDITEDVLSREKLKEKEKVLFEQSKMAAMGEMIGNIAHQWRQPLSIISTGATGIQLQKEYGELTDFELNNTCDLINKNAQYLSKTIDDFKNFIKGDREKKIFNVEDNIKSFLHLVEGSIKNHSIKIVLDLEKDILIAGYENELTQCLINIFNNAKDVLDEINEGDKIFFITTYNNKDSITICLQDNAGGIEESSTTKIFEPYFTTKHPSQGTGLGLSMTYTLIVEGMKGIITATNENFEIDNKKYYGAKFTITLPK